MKRPSFAALSVCGWLAACGVPAVGPPCGEEAATVRPVIYGPDDRLEYFAVGDADWRRLFEESAVVLATHDSLDRLLTGKIGELPTWGASAGLCPGEPFADQPVAAFCSGVLVDWDLVLTASHCLDLFSLADVRVLFGYYYAASGLIDSQAADVYDVAQVVARAPMDADPTSESSLSKMAPRTTTGPDYAWLRLSASVAEPRRPAALYTTAPALAAGDPLVAITAGGGVPLKLDAGGRVTNSGTGDLFIADTDTSGGSSGGGAFAPGGGLLGTLARGSRDFDVDGGGCATTRRLPDEAEAQEQFTYGSAAVAGLCAATPGNALCDTTCVEPCRVPDRAEPAGCAVAGQSTPLDGCLALLAVIGIGRRAASSRARSSLTARQATSRV